MRPLTAEELRAHCKRASKIVAKWPWWKRNLLEEAGKSTCRVPRTPILPSGDTAYKLVNARSKQLGGQ